MNIKSSHHTKGNKSLPNHNRSCSVESYQSRSKHLKHKNLGLIQNMLRLHKQDTNFSPNCNRSSGIASYQNRSKHIEHKNLRFIQIKSRQCKKIAIKKTNRSLPNRNRSCNITSYQGRSKHIQSHQGQTTTQKKNMQRSQSKQILV